MQWPDIFTNAWGLVLTLGVLVFIAVIAWAMLRNKQTPAEKKRTERATHDLYEDGASDRSE